jgi:hypothetical protein
MSVVLNTGVIVKVYGGIDELKSENLNESFYENVQS